MTTKRDTSTAQQPDVHAADCAQRIHGANECTCHVAAQPDARPDPLVMRHRFDHAEAYVTESGATGIFNITYAGLPEGVEIVGNGTCPHPLGVKLSGAYAVAPELLAALEGLFEHCAMIHKQWGEGCNRADADAAQERARAAIRKARGEA